MKIEIKKIDGRTIFEFEKENNTVRDTVMEAIERGVSLEGAELYGIDLSGANLQWVNLRGANLDSANLRGCVLSDANLCHSTLCNADLRDADLSTSNLRYACLFMANLDGANLLGADLRDAGLGGANLHNVILERTILSGAILNGAKDVPYIPLACPSHGSFIGWKKVNLYKETEYNGPFLVQLEIPSDARRCSATTEKCRCEKAKVLSITNIESGLSIDKITNINRGKRCIYEVGEMVYPDKFDENRWNECSNGIHFFVNKQTAIDY